MIEFARPNGIPEFDTPPLNEVVLGVQFPPAEGYGQINVSDVWRLFKDSYPRVEEHPPLAPAFETFGPPGSQQFQFNLGPVIPHSRYWFLSPDGIELIQFQNDRFLHNWRETAAATAKYPRFEALLAKFQKEYIKLGGYLRTLQGGRQLTCNQVEVTYINHIPFEPNTAHDPFDFLKVANFAGAAPDDISFSWRRAIRNSSGSPYARLIVEAQSAINQKGQTIIVFTLTVRGSPSVGTIGNVIEFMKNARITIIEEFMRVTTDSAQAKWGRR